MSRILINMLFCAKISEMVSTRAILWAAKREHLQKKWVVVSASWLQAHKSDWVSSNLWFILWLLRSLRARRSWKRVLVPPWLWIPNTDFLAGRMRDRREVLNREIDFKDVNSLPIKFQDLTVSGKGITCSAQLNSNPLWYNQWRIY